MDLHTPFDSTLKEFKIDGRTLSRESGVREATISEFRRGVRSINTDSLERMLAVLPYEAKQFYFLNCFGVEMDNKAIATLLHVVANKIRTGTEADVHVEASDEEATAYEDERIPA